MTWLNSPFTIEDAAARGHDVWELLVDEWGDLGHPSTDGSSKSFPPVVPGTVLPPAQAMTSQQGPAGTPGGPSVVSGQSRALPAPAAIAIGPRSTVDRCWVLWDIQKVLPNNTPWDYYRRLSVGAPLMFTQPANRWGVSVNPNTLVSTAGGAVTIYPEMPSQIDANDSAGNSYARQYYDWLQGTTFGAFYRKADGTISTFGSGVVTTGGAQTWIPPILHLYFYLKAPTAAPPAKRFPLSLNFGTFLDDETETLIGQAPVFGRRTITVEFNAAGFGSGATATTYDFRLGLIQQVVDVLAPGTDAQQEVTVFSAASVPAGRSVRTVIEPAYGDYLMIYATSHGAPGLLTGSALASVRADD